MTGMDRSPRCEGMISVPVWAGRFDGVVLLLLQDELQSLQIKAERYALTKFKEKRDVNDWPSLLNSVFVGFDRDALLPLVAPGVMEALEAKMKVSDAGPSCERAWMGHCRPF